MMTDLELNMKLEVLEVKSQNLIEKLERTLHQTKMVEDGFCQVRKEVNYLAAQSSAA